jgi:hypothetical protein
MNAVYHWLEDVRFVIPVFFLWLLMGQAFHFLPRFHDRMSRHRLIFLIKAQGDLWLWTFDYTEDACTVSAAFINFFDAIA